MTSETQHHVEWCAQHTTDGTSIHQGDLLLATIFQGPFHAEMVENLLELGKKPIELPLQEEVDISSSHFDAKISDFIDIDLTEGKISAALAEWSPEIQASIESRQAKEKEDGLIVVDMERFSGLVSTYNCPRYEFIQVAVKLSVVKCLVLLSEWQNKREDENVLAIMLAECQLASAISVPEATILIDRFEHLCKAGVLPILFDSKAPVIEKVLQWLKDDLEDEAEDEDEEE